MNELILASTNAEKLREMREILADSGFSVVNMDMAGIGLDFDFDSIETGSTFAENAVLKAKAVAERAGKPAIADDSGIVIDFLNGEPGVHSARYMGRDTSYEIKNNRIIEMMKDVPPERRGARFVCAIAAVLSDGRVIVEEAAFEGIIACKPRGANGFGYDPIFFVPELGLTSAQLTMEQKNAVSHRGKALRLMRDRLLSL